MSGRSSPGAAPPSRRSTSVAPTSGSRATWRAPSAPGAEPHAQHSATWPFETGLDGPRQGPEHITRKDTPMDFGLTDEQRAVVATTRAFVERELSPHEEEVERTGVLRPELAAQIRQKALAAGLYAANMPEEVGGAGLDTVTWVLYEKELGKASYALHYCGVPRPSNILLAGTEAQREKYLYPCVRGEKIDCLAMTEPGAGSDMRAMRTRATRVAATDGGGWRVKGSQQFI